MLRVCYRKGADRLTELHRIALLKIEYKHLRDAYLYNLLNAFY